MAPNPDTTSAVKSLRQVAPGGDIIAGIFAVIALLLLLGTVRNPPTNAISAVVDLVLIAAFALPAWVLYKGARATGLFASADALEYRALGRVRDSWKRAEISHVVSMSGGARLLGATGTTLHDYRFRWWSTAQVEAFARAAELAPPTALEAAASAARPSSTPEVEPGESGHGGEEQQPG